MILFYYLNILFSFHFFYVQCESERKRRISKSLIVFIHPERYIFYNEGKNFIESIASITLE